MFDYKYYNDKEPLSNYDILKLIPKYKITNFKGVFMRDNLPCNVINVISKTECGIVNLDSINNSGTHWVCYYHDNSNSIYFDSFGLFPPDEIKSYLHKNIISSTFQVQEFNTNYCGYLCLFVLSCLSKGYKYEDIILNLVKEFENYISNK